jgi:ubiquitin-conjugating enzyme E2 J2
MAARLRKEFARIESNPVPQIKAKPLDSNIFEWRFLLYDFPSQSAYAGGIYVGALIFPTEYPMRPPTIKMITPNGRFQVNTPVCMSMTDFSPQSWNPAWRVETIILGFLSFWLENTEPTTTGSVRSSFKERQLMAQNSLRFNFEKIAKFEEMFGDFLKSRKDQVEEKDYSAENESSETIKSVDSKYHLIFFLVALLGFILLYFMK